MTSKITNAGVLEAIAQMRIKAKEHKFKQTIDL